MRKADLWLGRLLQTVVVLLVVVASGALALREPDRSATPVLLASELVFSAQQRCPLSGAEALAQARLLEQDAEARWQRVPFALREAPHARKQMAQAEACYAASHERASWLRSSARRHAFEAHLARRFVHARLALQRLTRPAQDLEGDAPERALLQVATLRALLADAPGPADSQRSALAKLEQQLSARRSVRAGRDEEVP